MGIFDFVRNAGAKLFGKDKPETHGEPSKPLRTHVQDHGINPENLHFRFQNGVLIAEGWVPDQDTREKVILIVGNVDGVDKVDDRIQIGRPQATAGGSVPNQFPGVPGAVGASTSMSHKSPAEAPWSSKTYTVKSGDTLSKIAKEMYGDSSKYQGIFEANKPMLKDPDKIYPGQVLRVPTL